MMKREAELVCKVDLHIKWSWPLGSDHKKNEITGSVYTYPCEKISWKDTEWNHEMAEMKCASWSGLDI